MSVNVEQPKGSLRTTKARTDAALGAAVYTRSWIPAAISLLVVAWFWHPLADSVVTVLGLLLGVVACAVAARIWGRSPGSVDFTK